MGNVQFKSGGGNVLFTASGVAMDPACCCVVGCCPGGLPTAYTVSGHILITDTATAAVLCDTDFSVTVSGVADTCSWTVTGEMPCGGTIGSFLFELAANTGPCRWDLLINSGPSSAQTTTRTGAPTNMTPVGAYPNITGSNFLYTWAFTALAVS